MKQCTWLSLSLSTPVQHEEEVIALLDDLGTCGVLEEKKTNQTLYLKAYFADSIDVTVLKVAMKSSPLVSSSEIITIDSEDWANNWKQHFSPFYIAPNILIKPTWESYLAKPEDIIIEIDPGMAFGTGTHETTSLCASLLSEQRHLIKDATLLDAGCGSGILSIIAAKLGAAAVTACDNDPVALDVCRQNTHLNNCHSIVTFKHDLTAITSNFDLVVANILLNTLKSFKAEMTRQVKRTGLLILSGITTDQSFELIDIYSNFTHIATQIRGQWAAILMKRKEC